MEREFSVERSERESPRFLAELARHGTTTACWYNTIHEEICAAAFRAAERRGMRITPGKVMMDAARTADLRRKRSWNSKF